MGQHRVGDLHPLLSANDLIGGQDDRKAIEQVISNRPFFGVVGGNQQGPAGVAQAEPFPFHLVFAAANGGEKKIDDPVVEKVQLIHVEHTAVCFCQ